MCVCGMRRYETLYTCTFCNKLAMRKFLTVPLKKKKKRSKKKSLFTINDLNVFSSDPIRNFSMMSCMGIWLQHSSTSSATESPRLNCDSHYHTILYQK